MFSFIKKFFREEEKPKQELDLNQLKGWLDAKEGQLQEALRAILKEASGAIGEASRNLSGGIDGLREAKLQNPNIPPKALHFMQGNRDSYLKLATLFLRDAIPKDIASMNYGSARKFGVDFASKLEGFLSSSLRNYQVLQHFFAHESKAVGHSIRKIEEEVGKMQSAIGSAGLDALSKAREEINAIEEKLSRKKELKGQIAQEEGGLREILQKKQENEKMLQEVVQGEEYKIQLAKKEEVKMIDEDLSRQKKGFSERFSPLEKALRKYAKLAFEHEKMIARYAEQPENAVMDDSSFLILSILPKLEQELAKNTLGIDEKRAQKARDAIKSITKGFLEGHLKEVQRLRENRAVIEASLESSPLEKEMADLRALIGKSGTEETLARQRLSIAKEQLKGVSVQKHREEIESHLNASFSESITLRIEEEQEPVQETVQ